MGGAALVAVSLAIAVIINPGPLPGELGLVRWLQNRPQPVPRMAEWVRLTTSSEAGLVVLVIPGWVVISRFGHRGVFAVVIVCFTMLVLQPLLKLLVDRPRPSSRLVEIRAVNTSLSFPSGHSMSTTALWGVGVGLAIAAHRPRLAVVVAAPIVLTGVASSVQGVHWPSDAIAGTAIGALAAWATCSVLLGAPVNPSEPSHRRRPEC